MIISRHLTGTLSASFEALNDAARIMQACLSASAAAGATALTHSFHQFEPQGVTAFVLLAESHLTIHTWPELGRAMVDIATCGDHTDPVTGWRTLLGHLEAEVVEMNMVVRPIH